MEFCIYWTCTPRARERVNEVLHVPRYMTINGETYFSTNDQWTIDQLHDLEKRGFIKLRNKTIKQS